MTYEMITNRNVTSGFEQVFIYANDVTKGILFNGFLFGFWMIITLVVYFASKKDTGVGDLPVAMASSSFATLIITVMLRIVPGLVSGTVLTIVIGVFILSVLFLFFTRD